MLYQNDTRNLEKNLLLYQNDTGMGKTGIKMIRGVYQNDTGRCIKMIRGVYQNDTGLSVPL